MIKINTRIKEVRKSLQLTMDQFGEKIGLSKSGISSIENGNRNVTPKHIKLVCAEFNVNEEWLRTGNGEMFKQEKNYSLDEFLKKRNATSLEIEFMKIYFSLDESIRKKIISDFKKAVLEEEFSNPHSSENTNNEISATIESTVQEESDKIPLYFKPAHKMTDEEIEEEVAEYRRKLLLEKKQAEKSSVSSPQKNDCKKMA